MDSAPAYDTDEDVQKTRGKRGNLNCLILEMSEGRIYPTKKRKKRKNAARIYDKSAMKKIP